MASNFNGNFIGDGSNLTNVNATLFGGQPPSYYEGSTVTISSTAPSSPSAGDMWWDSEDGLLNVYYNSVWVEASPAASSIAQGTGSGLDADKVDGLHASQFLRSDTSDSMTGNLTVNGAITATADVTAYSDERLKENIEIIPNALAKVNQVRGVTFNRKSDGERSTGVIAQELQQVLPEAVKQDEEGMLNVAYGNVVGLLIEGMKEMSAKMESMQAEIDRLKEK